MDMQQWLDSVIVERADLKLAIDKIKQRISTGKNIESIVEDESIELTQIENDLKKQFSRDASYN